MILYINNSYVPVEDAFISPFDRGFLFADGVYESIRTYNKKLFRYDDHLERLKRSLREIGIGFDRFDSIEQIIYELIIRNKIQNEAFCLICRIGPWFNVFVIGIKDFEFVSYLEFRYSDFTRMR